MDHVEFKGEAWIQGVAILSFFRGVGASLSVSVQENDKIIVVHLEDIFNSRWEDPWGPKAMGLCGWMWGMWWEKVEKTLKISAAS